MTQKIATELFDLLGQDIKPLAIYQDLFDSSEPIEADGSFYLRSIENGLYISLSQSLKIESFVLHSEGSDNYQQYKKPLPGDLTFNFSRSEVKGRFGNPSKSGEAGGKGIFATPYSWDSYEVDGNFVTIQYNDDCNSISTIVVGILQ